MDLQVGNIENYDEPLEMEQLRSINSVSMNQGAATTSAGSQGMPLMLSSHNKRLNRVQSRGDQIQNGENGRL